MTFWIEFITVITEVLLSLFFIEYANPSIRIGHAAKFGFYCFYGIVLMLSTMYLNIPLRLLCTVMILICGGMFLMKLTWIRMLYLTALFFTSSMLSDLICGMILPRLGIDMNMIFNSSIGRLIYNFSAKLMHLILLILILSCMRIKNRQHNYMHIIPLLLCNVTSIIVLDILYQYIMQIGNTFEVDLAACCLFYINIVICFYLYSLDNLHYEQEQMKLSKQQMDMQIHQFQENMLQQEETRRLWHDIKKYTLALQSMLDTNAPKEAQNELNKLLDIQNSMAQIVDCGNITINNILNYEITKAHQHHIAITPKVWVPAELDLPATDLYVILGNAIDNAIEACSLIEDIAERTIQIQLMMHNRMLFFQCTNPCTEHKVSHLHKPFHGYGIGNIKQCIEAHQGTYTATKKDGIYTITCSIPA